MPFKYSITEGNKIFEVTKHDYEVKRGKRLWTEQNIIRQYYDHYTGKFHKDSPFQRYEKAPLTFEEGRTMGRKEPNPPPPTKNSAMQRMSKIFNEWNKRYSKEPESFTDTLDSNGKPVEDYGDCCALYFRDLENEMDEKGLLPISV